MKSIIIGHIQSILKPSAVAALFCCFFLSILFQPLAHAETHEAAFRPWSGYWWPKVYGGLGTGIDYRGRPAPLEKYNLLTTGMTSGLALTEYLKEHYDPDAPGWYGLCIYWARAASYENINILPSSENNIIFRVGDKKGLLSLAHKYDVDVSGNGYRPEEFHFWLLKYIKDERKAFVADFDAGEQIWSYPIYKYDMTTSVSGNVESVSVNVYAADDGVRPDYIGTLDYTAQYTYNLFLDKTGAITGGEWTGDSIANHPDLMRITTEAPGNFPGLDYQEVLRLAKSRDDFLENGSKPVEIGPGTYNLVLLDEDVYTIPMASGDLLSVRIEREWGSFQNINVAVMDGNGMAVKRATVSNASPLLDILLTSSIPPYTIHLTQGDYADPSIYLLKVDVKRSYSQEVPYIPQSSGWSGFALTNPGSAGIERVTLTTQDADGAPIQTVLGPLRLEPGEKRIFLFDDLPVRLHERSDTTRLTLSADGPVAFLNLLGRGNNSLATLVQGNARGLTLVIPDTAPSSLGSGVNMFGGVRNESFEEADVTIRVYSAKGVLQQELSETIAARGWFSITPGYSPFYTLPKSGWIEIQGNGEQTLSGFQYTSDSSGVETLFALPVGSTKKIVPDIPEPGYWSTQLTLINPNDQENEVRLHLALAGVDTAGDLNIVLAPREKRIIEIQNQFGKSAGDSLYHSILEITGRHPLVGYCTYSTLNGGDDVSYPLQDETQFKSTLSLPHYPGNDGYWWTGIVVYNPSLYAEEVKIEPYDHNGNLMEASAISIRLNAGTYDVFEVASRFGESASAISFLRFRTEGDSGVIGGFYLYGDRGNRILSGANM